MVELETRELVQRPGLAVAIAELAAQREDALELGARRVRLALGGGDPRQRVASGGRPEPVVELAEDRQRALAERSRLRVVLLDQGHEGEHVPRGGLALPIADPLARLQQQAERGARLLERAKRLVQAARVVARQPAAACDDGEPLRRLGAGEAVAVGVRPVQRLGGAPTGIGVRFELPSGANAALAALSLPAFGPRDAHDFLAIVKAQKPVMKANKPNPLALLAFAVRRLYAIPGLKAVATHPTRASFATTRFNGLHAFFAVDESGARRAFRFRLMPLAGIVPMDPADYRLLPPQYLVSELKTRLQDGPAEWDLVFQLGEPGDRTDDVTKQWPEDRRQVTVGRLVVDRVHEDPDAADRLV